jgi:hypothetical protein
VRKRRGGSEEEERERRMIVVMEKLRWGHTHQVHQALLVYTSPYKI